MKIEFRTAAARCSTLGVVGLTMALCGCGGASVTPTTTAPALPAIALTSSVLPKTHVLPKQYACNPKIGVPPLQWGAVPGSTKALALVVYFVSSKSGAAPQISPQAALTGLKPTLHALKAGVLPHGAVVASDSRVMCPEKGLAATYFVRMYALKSKIKVSRGANVAAALNAIAPSAVAVGSLEVHYRRA
jgi:hypothetical protein